FVLLAFVSSIFSSAAAFIWIYTHAISAYDWFSVWQGWWTGFFLQDMALVAPVLSLAGPAVMRWRDRHAWPLVAQPRFKPEILLSGGVLLAGLLLYLYITVQLGARQIDAALASAGSAAWRDVARSVIELNHATYWVVLTLILFFAFFAYPIFSYWTSQLKGAAQELAESNRHLREQRDLYQALVDAQSDIGEGLAIIDEARFVFVNQALCELTGYSESELKAMSSFVELADFGERERLLSNHRRRLAGEQFENRYEVRLLTCSGLSLEVELAVAYIVMEHRMRVVVVISDIRVRKQAEKALRRAKEVAEHASAAKSRFLASASHDLRQPLQALTMFTSTLKKQGLAPEAGHLLGLMEVSIGALRDLLDTLLDISKLEAGIVEAQRQAVPIEYIFDRLEDEFRLQFEAKGLRFRLHYPLREVDSDPMLLLMILRHLLSNAIRHTEQGGVLLSARLRRDGMLIQVWDSGSGIAAGELDKIFQEFYQVDNAARDRRKGLGLGLAIVERVAQLLETQVDVRSRPGRGTVFEFGLPLASPGSLLSGESDALSPPLAAHRAQILIIDDEPDVLLGTRMLLDSFGYSTLAAGSLDEALALVEGSPSGPDLILADYRLQGGVTGGDAIEQIGRRLGVAIPGVLITGDTAPERLQEAKRSGCVLLHKPVDPEELEQIVNRLLALGASF
ncbi:MAG: PAS domain S-box protein, partial [Sulfuricellaceae bacterium]|nr:PAS domain S-box protein [Sulfuricellaceae bacterium]